MRIPALLALALTPIASPQPEFFGNKIRPVLATRCYACHSAAKPTSGLAVDSKAGLERGGTRGNAIHPGDPSASLLLKAISYTDPALKMPPDGTLPDTVIADFRDWIRQGAFDPRTAAPPPPSPTIDWERAKNHWAFQPLAASPRGASIDAFLNARIQKEKLQPAPPADKAALLRR